MRAQANDDNSEPQAFESPIEARRLRVTLKKYAAGLRHPRSGPRSVLRFAGRWAGDCWTPLLCWTLTAHNIH